MDYLHELQLRHFNELPSSLSPLQMERAKARRLIERQFKKKKFLFVTSLINVLQQKAFVTVTAADKFSFRRSR